MQSATLGGFLNEIFGAKVYMFRFGQCSLTSHNVDKQIKRKRKKLDDYVMKETVLFHCFDLKLDENRT